MAATAGWALVSAGSWICSTIGTVGATVAGVAVAAPLAATTTTAVVAYEYGVKPVVNGTSAVVSMSLGAVAKGTRMTVKGVRYLMGTSEDYVYEDEDED